MKGIIKKLTDKGFGFISKEDGDSQDLFFHASELAEGLDFSELRDGDAVEFEVAETDRGPKAVNVKRA